MKYLDVFAQCSSDAISGVLIKRASTNDKEFHFQNWFKDCLNKTGLAYDSNGRNQYPDFTLVNSPEGFELKGLEYPGRTADYDCNSQMPKGLHNRRDIYYVFGRYPKAADTEFPIIDLTICHGSFINCDNDYVHENKNVKGFGSYGDIMIRDRKMYVAPTPFALTNGTTSQRTLIVPELYPVDARFIHVGDLIRTEASELVSAYNFDLQTNIISPTRIPNPRVGTQHKFKAYRLQADNPTVKVVMSSVPVVLSEE